MPLPLCAAQTRFPSALAKLRATLVHGPEEKRMVVDRGFSAFLPKPLVAVAHSVSRNQRHSRSNRSSYSGSSSEI